MVEPGVDARNVPYGIRLVAQRARTDKIMEGQSRPPGSVTYDNGIYQCCSMSSDSAPSSTASTTSVTMIASESNDGFHWKERGRSKLAIPGQRRGGFGWFIDPHGSPKERYKAVYMARPPESEIPTLLREYQKLHPRFRDVRISLDEKCTYLYGMTSPNGVDWRPIAKPLMTHVSDTDTTVYYDDWLRKYIMYTRLYRTRRRLIAIAESDDFRHWGPVRPLIWPGLDEPFSTDIYLNARTCYPDMPEVHLMFPMFYRRYDQTSEVRLFSSIDGLNWSQVPGGSVLTPEAIGHHAEFIGVTKNLVPLGNDKVGVPYFATPYPHKFPRWKSVMEAGSGGWAWWEKGRLAAITSEEEGQFVTFDVPVMGRELRLNARTPRAGMIKVELLDQDGRSLNDCDPIVGDNFAHVVRWKGKSALGVTEGKPVAIKFHLRQAELFGFEWVT